MDALYVHPYVLPMVLASRDRGSTHAGPRIHSMRMPPSTPRGVRRVMLEALQKTSKAIRVLSITQQTRSRQRALDMFAPRTEECVLTSRDVIGSPVA